MKNKHLESFDSYFPVRRALVASATLLFVIQSATAADLYWDADGDTSAATGGTANWSTAGLWRIGTSTGPLQTWADANAAFLGGTAGTITLNTSGSVNISPSSLNVTATGYKITTPAGDRLLKVTGNLSLGANVALTLEKSGTGGAKFDAGIVTGGAGSSLTLSSGVTGVNAFELSITQASGSITTPVIISSITDGSIGISSSGASGQQATISGGISNSSTATTFLKAYDNTALTLQTVGISGTSGAVFGNGTGGGTINLNVASTYGGSTSVNTAATGTVKLGLTNALPTTTALTMTQGILDLQANSQSIGSLSGVGGSIKGIAGSTLSIGGNGTTTYSGKFESALAVTKTGMGTLTLAGNNTNSGATAVNAGTLVVSGSLGGSAVSVSNSGTILASGPTGTLGSSVIVNSGAILAAGNQKSIGTATVVGATTFNDSSIFSWDVSSNGATYDKLVSASLVDGGSIGGSTFRVVAPSGGFSDPFWAMTQTWTDIFTNVGSTAIANWAAIFNIELVDNNLAAFTPMNGGFTASGNTLTWTAVPEPTSALAGLLIVSGLLRRRRSAGR